MLTFQLNSEDLLHLRFGSSPLMELVISYRIMTSTKRTPYAYDRWCEAARRATDGLDLSFIKDMVAVGHFIPDFLTPSPVGMAPNIEDELERVRTTPVDFIQDQIERLIDLGGMTPIRERFLIEPQASVAVLIDQLYIYWQRALAAHWSNIQAILEGDVLYRARKQALEGAPAVFDQIHPSVVIEGNTVRLIQAHQNDRIITSGRGILLTPTFFAGRAIFWQDDKSAPVMLAYAPRGLGNWQQPEADDVADKALEIALGAGRAQVLQHLHTPGSTSELAARLSVTAGAVSQHLSKLQQAGLVEPHRSGKRVYYHLTARGAQLLAVFDMGY